MELARLLPVILLISAFFSSNLGVKAQVYDLVILDSESGIAGIQVNDITQDAEGYIWVATNTGVSRYDGKNFVNYVRRDGLAENNCTTIFCDSENRVWVGHQTAGISIIYPDSIQRISEENGLANNEVHDIFQDRKGKIWVATFGGVSRFDGAVLTNLTTDNGLVSNNTQAISQDDQGGIWIGTFGSGLTVIDGKKTHQIHMGNGLVNNYVTSLKNKNGHMMVGTLGGLSIWKDNSFKNTSSMDGLSNSQVNEVAIGENGDIWLATYGGLNRVRNAELLQLTEANGLPNNELLSVFIDTEGNVWLGTQKGLVRIQNLAFAHYFSTSELDIEPSFLYRDSKGILWAANEAGGVLQFDGETFMKAFDDPDINDRQISSIAEDGDGNLWFGTMDFGGLFQFDGEKLYIYSDEFGLADNNINCLLQDSEGNLLIGTPNGLSQYDGSGFRNIFVSDDMDSQHITSMQLADDGTVYLGTAMGDVFLLKNGNVDGEIDVDSESSITDFAIGEMGLAIATQSDGLFLFKDGIVNAIEADNVLRSSSARSVAFLGSDLFLGGTNGLHKLSITGDFLKVIEFDSGDGFLGSACKRGVMLAQENTLWIGTSKGIVRYVPSEELSSLEKPRLLLTNLQLFFKEMDWLSLDYTVSANGLPQDLKLDHTQNSLQFYFRGIHHRNPKGVQFRWILEGHETTWNPSTNAEYASYPNLPPGDFTFRLVACNDSGVCSEPVEFKLIITPPIWKTISFYVGWVIVLLIITYAYIKIRERRLLEEKRILEETVTERTQELREQKEIVEGQNKHIMEGIDYAKNIQMAVLPSEEDMKEAFDEHFVFYRPKDTVGGDFYWVFSEGDISWAAAVDCTGHGVAGAFMSMIGTDLLNQIIIEKKIDNPAEVLAEMDKGIKLAFAQSAKEFESDQGMDMVLIRIDRKQKAVDFAGAQRPLFIMQDGELIQIEGNKLSISCAEQRRKEAFENHRHRIKGNTVAYLFSDGIVDQFGGPKGKKFMVRRVREFLNETKQLPIAEQSVQLTKTFDDWKGEKDEQIDDVMLLGIRL